MRKNNQGVILLTTLLLLSVITLLMLTQTQLLFMRIKIDNARLQQDQNFRQLELIAQSLLRKKKEYQHASCQVDSKDANLAIELVDKFGCSIIYRHSSYRFIFENIGAVPCLQISLKNKVFTSFQWRLTVKSTNTPTRILQLRISEPVAQQQCEQVLTEIKKGIISWRYIV